MHQPAILEGLPSLVRLSSEELWLLKVIRLLTPEQRADLMELGITLASKNFNNAEMPGNVYLLADPQRKFR